MSYTYNPANMNQRSDVASMMKARPYLRMISIDAFNKLPSIYDKVFTVKNSTLSVERENTTGLGGQWAVLAEKSEHVYSNIDEGTEISYTNVTYADAIDLSIEMVDDNQWKEAFQGAKLLGRGAYSALEDACATIYDNAFTSGTGADGTYLCNSAHNLINSSSTGDNMITAVLDPNGIKSAFALGRRVVNESGIFVPMFYDTLLVPPELEEIAIQLCVNEAKPGTANRDINVYNKNSYEASNYTSRIKKIVVNPFLSSTSAWFLIASMAEEKPTVYMRQPVSFNLERDPHTNAYLHQGRMRFAPGFTNWQGVIGSTGTGA